MALLFTVGFVVVGACSAPEEFGLVECNPDPFAVYNRCVDPEPDAGTDAADAGDDGDLGLDATASNEDPTSCQGGAGRCVPVPEGGEQQAGLWSKEPIALLVATTPKKGDPPLVCPPGMVEQFRLHADLDAPPAECEPCECGPSSGTCTELPASIEVRAGTCAESGVMSVPFDGPAGWDGSCTSANALPAGADCGGEPCAQSVVVSALPGPTTEEPCQPVKATPDFTTKTEWKTAMLGCTANLDDDSCNSTKKSCVADPGLPYLQCVHREGTFSPEDCPMNYRFAWYVGSPEDVIDDRGCEDCACGPPEGGGCKASIRLYNDEACTSQFEQGGLASGYEKCINVVTPGRAIGAKAITDLEYVPGACASGGGTPRGLAAEDASRAVTFCCLYSLYIDIQ
ncbi:hypothetical protein [Polyangium spumosum]|nr:hypothetical protein [Polyangium spumosum]